MDEIFIPRQSRQIPYDKTSFRFDSRDVLYQSFSLSFNKRIPKDGLLYPDWMEEWVNESYDACSGKTQAKLVQERLLLDLLDLCHPVLGRILSSTRWFALAEMHRDVNVSMFETHVTSDETDHRRSPKLRFWYGRDACVGVQFIHRDEDLSPDEMLLLQIEHRHEPSVIIRPHRNFSDDLKFVRAYVDSRIVRDVLLSIRKEGLVYQRGIKLSNRTTTDTWIVVSFIQTITPKLQLLWSMDINSSSYTVEHYVEPVRTSLLPPSQFQIFED